VYGFVGFLVEIERELESIGRGRQWLIRFGGEWDD